MLEWLMGTDCKSAGEAYAGSNPARPKDEIEKLLRILDPFFFTLVITEFLFVESVQFNKKFGIDGSRTRNFRLDRAVL